MKFSNLVALVASQALCVLAASDRADREAQCGALGVMEVDVNNLPAGVDPNEIRTCLEHPKSLLDVEERGLEKRKCEQFPSGPHCSKSGWCYVNCGDPAVGKWCWLAANGGFGAWSGCGNDHDCVLAMDVNALCGAGKCDACGCGC